MTHDTRPAAPTAVMHRAVVRTGTTVCEARDVPTPAPGPGEVLLAPEAVALCGTDIQILRRMRPDPADVVGHEGFARVVAVGEDVGVGRSDAGRAADGGADDGRAADRGADDGGADDGGRGPRIAVGDRVMVNPTAPGNPDFLLGHNVPGLFQERVLIDAAGVSGGQLLPVPEELDAVTGTLTEPLAVVTYALECLRRAGARHLVVDGGGLIGLLAAAWAPRVLGPGAGVTVLHRHDDVRRWARDHVPGRHVTWTAEPGGPAGRGPAGRGPAADLAGVPEHAGLISAVYRDATVGHVGQLLGALRGRLAGVHTIGGVPTPAVPRGAGGVDLSATRSDNTGGPWPPTVHHGDGVAFTGNRGVTNERLRRAADDLVAHGAAVAPLLTHVAKADDGVALMNRVVAGTRRDPGGNPVVRLVIRFA